MTAVIEDEVIDGGEVVTGQVTEEQADFLRNLEKQEEEENLDPDEVNEQEQTEAAQKEFEEQAVKMTAIGGLSAIEFALKRFLHPEFEFTPSTKEYAVENLAPVLIKYGAVLPLWLSAYDAEIKAAMAVGTLVNEGVGTVKELRAKDAEKAKADKAKADNDKVAA